ncbi:MAG: flagellar hook assembly protein FlgD [Betaproteobacteria bacterium]|nr:flagellar hook assembly protein FlgD [Betaproteobacteria bacterium]
MAISAVNSATAAAATSSNASTNQVAATENRFLALLVAQMKNQDPLNPLDNAQVTSQMAQLSTVQGVNQMNSQLTQLLSEFQNLQAMTLSGRSVLVPGDKLVLGAPATGTGLEARGGLELAGDATSVKVQVKNAAGAVVRTLDLGARAAGVSSFKWDGLGDDGKALPAGNYAFAVTANAGTQAVASQPLAAAKVEGVNRNANGIQLDLGNLGTVSFGEVLQVL